MIVLATAAFILLVLYALHEIAWHVARCNDKE
jgi:hypothetical protein